MDATAVSASAPPCPSWYVWPTDSSTLPKRPVRSRARSATRSAACDWLFARSPWQCVASRQFHPGLQSSSDRPLPSTTACNGSSTCDADSPHGRGTEGPAWCGLVRLVTGSQPVGETIRAARTQIDRLAVPVDQLPGLHFHD